MRRREFFGLVGGAALLPTSTLAQQAEAPPTIGFLAAAAPSARNYFSPTVQRLRELGWIEGQKVRFEFRSAMGQSRRLTDIAEEFVRLNVNIIVAQGTAAALAAKRATSAIPIVFAPAGDPIGNGLVTSLAKPGANLTGLSIQQKDLSGKRIGMLRELLPNLRGLAIMGNVANPSTVLDMAEARTTAHRLGIEVVAADIRNADDIAPACDAIKSRSDALYVASDPLIFSNRIPVARLALEAKLPTIMSWREYVQAGGLISYGPQRQAYFRRSAEFVDKILHGTAPADIPVEQPTRFDLAINIKTAKVLGLTVPTTLLTRADEVIE
jgi:putative ABC transport system substrate-binding protein